MKKNAKNKTKKTINGGWMTSDEDEIIRRQLRAENEKIHIKSLDDSYYGSFSVYSDNWSDHDNAKYLVEIRSLSEKINSCNCIDFQINGLGTCKHIESVLLTLKKQGKRKFYQAAKNQSPHIEIFLNRYPSDPIKSAISIKWPDNFNKDSETYSALDQFFSQNGFLVGEPLKNILLLKNTVKTLNEKDNATIRFSAHIDEFCDRLRKEQYHKIFCDDFLVDIKSGKRNFEYLKHPLYPYQQDGILHLAFKKRALLGDEMGLGKTVQAIGACELLHHIQGVEKVLVIATASLKAEWEEQIAKFTDSKSLIIQGAKANRLKQYGQSAFYYLTNYEQILYDSADIQRLLVPDIIILDEAQRIKNWHTKVAKAVKMLSCPYAFVLTGTPLENRIDDIYSIVQFLNPHLFGSLFRFNREFYTLDEKGRSIGYKNLDKLHHQLKPILLRRRKSEVEEQLPERIINNYFVAMNDAQIGRYSEYEAKVAKLLRFAKERPLTKEESEKLQKYLACMRMLCDTPYILDENCRESPKLQELEKILEGIIENQHNVKIIIFSEWERMLQLIRELANKVGIGYAWHTGSVNQNKRRDEINRFKGQDDCCLFLSTDAGSVGLNLQVANIVINMDLPWNPAKLEQRIARAWRKNQQRNVQVINLISEGTIEHRMVDLLNKKSALAKTILYDGSIKEMELPSGKNAFIEQIENLLGMPNMFYKNKEKFPAESFDEKQVLYQFKIDTLADCQKQLVSLETHQNEQKKKTILAVIKNNDKNTEQQIQQRFLTHKLDQFYSLEIINEEMYLILKRLAEAGIVKTNHNSISLFEIQEAAETRKKEQSARINKSIELLNQTERTCKLSALLINEGFCQEGLPHLKNAIEKIVMAFSYANNICNNLEKEFTSELKEKILERTDIEKNLFEKTLSIFNKEEQMSDLKIQEWQNTSQILSDFVKENLNKLALKVPV